MRVGEKSHYLLSDYLHLLKKWTTETVEASDEERQDKIQELKNQMKAEMEEEFNESKARDYVNDEDFYGKFGLSEHFYGEDIDIELPIMVQKVCDNLDRFIESSWHSKIVDYFNNAKFVYIEHPRIPSFDAMKLDVSRLEWLRDVSIMASPDFGVTNSDTDYVILDWKSGKEDILADEITNQLKVYALKMLLKKWTTSIEWMRIEAHEVYLQSMNSHGWMVSQKDIDDIIAKIQSDVKEQKALLIDWDPYKNEPLSHQAFRKTTSTKKCESCTFRSVCEKLT